MYIDEKRLEDFLEVFDWTVSGDFCSDCPARKMCDNNPTYSCLKVLTKFLKGEEL